MRPQFTAVHPCRLITAFIIHGLNSMVVPVSSITLNFLTLANAPAICNHCPPTLPHLRVRVGNFIYLFLFSLTSLSRLFHSYRDEPIGRWGETGVPRENHLTHPQAEHGLSHMWPVQGSNLHQSQRRDD